MRKGVMFGAAACLAMDSTMAFSQSSVTLYGIVDNSIQYVKNAGGHSSQVSLVSGQLNSDRWGLKGSEELGGGTSAVFQLENSFNINTGSSGEKSIFGHRAFVGLSNSNVGAVTLGLQFDALTDLVMQVQGNNWLEYFTAPGDIDNADGSTRSSNAVKWASPNWGGVQIEATYALGGIAGTLGSGQSYSAAVYYGHGPFAIAGGYQHIDNGNQRTSLRGTSTTTSIFNSPVNNAYSSAATIDIVRSGGTYTVGPVTMGINFSFANYVADGYSSFPGRERYRNGAAFGLWQVTTATQFEIGYDFLKSSGNSSATYHQVALAGDFALSKRTDLYAVAAYAHASGKNGIGVSQAVISDTIADAGSASQTMIILGIRHKF